MDLQAAERSLRLEAIIVIPILAEVAMAAFEPCGAALHSPEVAAVQFTAS